MIKRIHHIGIAVADPVASADFYGGTLGLADGGAETVPSQQTRVHFFPVGDSRFELLHPDEPGSAVARFLEKRGPGVHHICLEVDDLDAEVARLRAAGVQFLSDAPQAGAHGARVIFLHPRSCFGVLMELNEFPRAQEEPA